MIAFPTHADLPPREPEVFKIQTRITGSAGSDTILIYNKDRSIEGSFHDSDTLEFLSTHGLKSFWLANFKGGIIDLENGVPVEDPGW